MKFPEWAPPNLQRRYAELVEGDQLAAIDLTAFAARLRIEIETGIKQPIPPVQPSASTILLGILLTDHRMSGFWGMVERLQAKSLMDDGQRDLNYRVLWGEIEDAMQGVPLSELETQDERARRYSEIARAAGTLANLLANDDQNWPLQLWTEGRTQRALFRETLAAVSEGDHAYLGMSAASGELLALLGGIERQACGLAQIARQDKAKNPGVKGKSAQRDQNRAYLKRHARYVAGKVAAYLKAEHGNCPHNGLIDLLSVLFQDQCFADSTVKRWRDEAAEGIAVVRAFIKD